MKIDESVMNDLLSPSEVDIISSIVTTRDQKKGRMFETMDRSIADMVNNSPIKKKLTFA